jgi:hypothetical protein
MRRIRTRLPTRIAGSSPRSIQFLTLRVELEDRRDIGDGQEPLAGWVTGETVAWASLPGVGRRPVSLPAIGVVSFGSDSLPRSPP